MPNGDPNWGVTEYPMLEAFFAQIADVLEDFAQKHNLKINKYYHQSPSWSFLFRHPEGGVGRIDVARCQDNQVIVSPAWWIDSYEDLKRSLKEEEGIRCACQAFVGPPKNNLNLNYCSLKIEYAAECTGVELSADVNFHQDARM